MSDNIKYKIWKFELVFENCECIEISPDAIKSLSFNRIGKQDFMCDSSSGMIMCQNELVDNFFITIDLSNKDMFKHVPVGAFTNDPIERLKTCDDITHFTINNEYLTVPWKELEDKPYTNGCQITVQISDNKLSIRISKDTNCLNK